MPTKNERRDAASRPADLHDAGSDNDSSRAYERELAEVTVDTDVNGHVVEYDGIDTRTPEANLASRSNIVSDGPGTTGAVGSLGDGPR